MVALGMALALAVPDPSLVAQEGLQGVDPPAERRAEILAFIEAYYAAMSDRDWEAYATFFEPGAMIATLLHEPGQPRPRILVHTVEEFVEQAPSGPGSREIFEERMEAATVLALGELAVVWARYTARFGDPGEVTTWKGIDAFSLLKVDGRWRIVSLTFGSLDGGAGGVEPGR